MMLKNLINVMDDEIRIAVYTKTRDKSDYRYNFKVNAWDMDTTLTPDKVITRGEFVNHPLFKTYKNNNLKVWGILKAKLCKGLGKDFDTKRGIIVSITIDITTLR